jgi:hypothetical protein
MDTVHQHQDPHAAAKEKLERENPRSWIWDEDGDEFAGFYWKSDFWTQKDGTDVEVRIAKTQGTGYRAAWLFESPQDLRRVFEDLDEDGLEEGDYIVVRRLPMRQFLAEDGERRKFRPFEGTRIPAAEIAAPSPAEPDGEEAATQAALETERDERDAALSQLHSPLESGGADG